MVLLLPFYRYRGLTFSRSPRSDFSTTWKLSDAKALQIFIIWHDSVRRPPGSDRLWLYAKVETIKKQPDFAACPTRKLDPCGTWTTAPPPTPHSVYLAAPAILWLKSTRNWKEPFVLPYFTETRIFFFNSSLDSFQHEPLNSDFFHYHRKFIPCPREHRHGGPKASSLRYCCEGCLMEQPSPRCLSEMHPEGRLLTRKLDPHSGWHFSHWRIWWWQVCKKPF